MSITISQAETARIESAIQAAVSGLWKEFTKLTDEPFPNEASMIEQFEDSSRRLHEVGENWELTSGIGIVPDDGTRLITVMIKAPPTVDIVFTLHSTSDQADSTISIWTFAQIPSWDD